MGRTQKAQTHFDMHLCLLWLINDPLSEIQLNCKLQDPGIERLCDLPERRRIDVLRQRRAGDEEVCVVENIEHFRTEFNVRGFSDRRPLDHTHVEIPVAWPTDGCQLQTSNRTRRWIAQQRHPICDEVGVKHQRRSRGRIEEESGALLKLFDRQCRVDCVDC